MASITRCDRCGVECPKLQNARIECHDYSNVGFDGYSVRLGKDLCIPCFNLLQRWLNETPSVHSARA